MIKRLIYYFLERRHFWRYISFSELAELYTSRALRIMALSMANTFIAIYMYQNGYSLTFILFYLAIYCVFRGLAAWPSAYLIGRFGPKSMTMVSNLVYVPALLCLSVVPEYGIVAIAAFGLLQGFSSELYEICYMVDFSKVRHGDHTGKEMGYMTIVENIAKSVSPLLGGLIAMIFSPQATIITAAFLFAIAALPLMFSPEPTRTHQKISFRSVPYAKIWRGGVAFAARGADILASGAIWSLAVAIMVFGTAGNVVYMQIGALASLTILVAVISARIVGLLVDRRRGGLLLQIGVIGNALTHASRPFVVAPAGVLTVNVVNEAVSTAYHMPLIQGAFDMVDRLSGFRIAYLSIMSAASSVGAAILALVGGLVSLASSESFTLQIVFILTAAMSLLIMAHGLPALGKRRFF